MTEEDGKGVWDVRSDDILEEKGSSAVPVAFLHVSPNQSTVSSDSVSPLVSTHTV